MNVFDKFKEKAWAAIKRKAVEVIVAMLTAAITALTTTSCMGFGPLEIESIRVLKCCSFVNGLPVKVGRFFDKT